LSTAVVVIVPRQICESVVSEYSGSASSAVRESSPHSVASLHVSVAPSTNVEGTSCV